MRSLLVRMFAAASFGLLAATASASPEQPKAGLDYLVLETAQPTSSGDKVEVTEFFWYSCPHCNALEPMLNEWVAKQGERIVFKRVPVAFRESNLPQSQLYYALEAMGQLGALHGKVFHAIHVQRTRLDTKEQIADWIAKQGVDRQKFLEVYDSFGVRSKTTQSVRLRESYQVSGVPLLAVDGRYLTSPATVAQSLGQRPEPVLYAATFKVLDHLVAQVEKSRGGAQAKTAK